ncbi:unnamed protein product [Citrullus colocynthis]|uniref:Uncharacterized protein n=1 Tax=Citrullus colocynthis TaxID=252529 RepID=A0ABP0ZB19_9ROSI
MDGKQLFIRHGGTWDDIKQSYDRGVLKGTRIEGLAVRGTTTGDLQNPVTGRNSSLENFTICPLRSKYMVSSLRFWRCTSLSRIWWTNKLLNTMSMSTNLPDIVLLNISSYPSVSFSLMSRFTTPMCDDNLVTWAGKRSSTAILKFAIYKCK